MTRVGSFGTYLPPWSKGDRRVKGPDEDALTMAVAAGRAADPDAVAQRVVIVSRNFPLVEGGNSAVLLAALGLADDVPVTEVLGGAPAVLDQIVSAAPETLVIGSDDNRYRRARPRVALAALVSTATACRDRPGAGAGGTGRRRAPTAGAPAVIFGGREPLDRHQPLLLGHLRRARRIR